jgi:hypothetical protein
MQFSLGFDWVRSRVAGPRDARLAMAAIKLRGRVRLRVRAQVRRTKMNSISQGEDLTPLAKNLSGRGISRRHRTVTAGKIVGSI